NAAADRCGADFIAVAHHADDQAETVLLRLLRGAGAAGLGAMRENGPGRIIRPLLKVSRADVLAYLDSIGAAFVVDSTNSSIAIRRNRVRHELIPHLEREYGVGLRERLVALADEMRSLDDFAICAARTELNRTMRGDSLDITRFANLPPALAAATIRE